MENIPILNEREDKRSPSEIFEDGRKFGQHETELKITKQIDNFIAKRIGYGGPTTRRFEELKEELEKINKKQKIKFKCNTYECGHVFDLEYSQEEIEQKGNPVCPKCKDPHNSSYRYGRKIGEE